MMEIASILLPIIMVGGIVIFVIKRLEQKYKRGTLRKKKSNSAQHLLDSLIPLGMLFGSMLSSILSLLFHVSFLTTISLGAGIGYLFGYLAAYEIYGRKRKNYS